MLHGFCLQSFDWQSVERIAGSRSNGGHCAGNEESVFVNSYKHIQYVYEFYPPAPLSFFISHKRMNI